MKKIRLPMEAVLLLRKKYHVADNLKKRKNKKACKQFKNKKNIYLKEVFNDF